MSKFRHVVMFRYVEGATAEQRAALLDGLSRLPSQVPEIRGYHFGEDVGLVDGNYDLVIIAEFDNIGDYRSYVANAQHQELIAAHIVPVVAVRSAVQFEMPG
ncbi:MAG: Dabb family protein [Ilumatobacteraceae bacterium]